MDDALADALAGDTVVYSNALVAVTRNCVVVRDGSREAKIIIAIDTITSVRRVITTNPGFLVISCGLFTIAAAAYVSKQGLQVSIPIALIASLFVMGYVGTRRAAVLFLLENESVESLKGSFREATAVIHAVDKILREQKQTDAPGDQSI